MSLYEDLCEKMQGKQYQDYWMAVCPFHKSIPIRNSLMVHEDGFYCMSCSKRGSLVYLSKFLGIVKDYTPVRDTKVIPKFKRWMEDESIEEIAYRSHKFLMARKEYQGYLRDRKALEFMEPGMFGFRDGWITIPVKDEHNKIVNLICRGISQDKSRYVLLQQTECSVLYVPDWERVKKDSFVVVVYGIFDAWSIWSLGQSVITGTTGASLPASLLKPLDKIFVIVPDRGEEREAYNLANELGWHGDVKRIKYPEGTKDCDDIRRQFGKTALLRLLEA